MYFKRYLMTILSRIGVSESQTQLSRGQDRVEITIKQLGVSFMDLKFKNMRTCSSREYRDLVPFDNLST